MEVEVPLALAAGWAWRVDQALATEEASALGEVASAPAAGGG